MRFYPGGHPDDDSPVSILVACRYLTATTWGDLSMAKARSAPFVWVTWLAPLLAGEASCEFALWFKATHMYDKEPPANQAQLTRWTAEHSLMVSKAKAQLERQGYTVTLEHQNAFKLQGKRALLSGKPDLVAVRPEHVRVIDCKTGERRDKDLWQVLIYLFALPLGNRNYQGKTLIGELWYRTGDPVVLTTADLTDVKRRIVELIKKAAGSVALLKTPSARECQFCDITQADCPERITEEQAVVTVDVGF